MICPVHARALERPGAEALVCGAEHLTWGELDARVTALAGALAEEGVCGGDSIALRAPNSIALVVHVLALARLGARAVMLSTRLTEIEIAAQLDRLRPRRVITLPPSPLVGERAGVRGAQNERTTLHPSAGAVLFTSGTTGIAKAAFIRHRAFEAAALASRKRLGTGPDSRWLCSLPLFHIGGLAMLWRCVHDGSALVLSDRLDADERVTHTSLVATTLLRAIEHGAPKLPHLRAVLVGGGPTPPGLVDEARAAGIPVRLTYGLTEACSQVTTQASASGHDAGTPLDGLSLRLAPDSEIEVRGPTLFTCYLFDERATAAARGDGWLKTGDFGALDSAGRLTVLGRRNDLLISGGENVYPAEIEAALVQHPAVSDAGVLALDDAHWGQVPLALVVTRGGQLDEAGLREWCRGRLAAYKVPARFRPVAALPRNAMGKLDRRALAALQTIFEEAT